MKNKKDIQSIYCDVFDNHIAIKLKEGDKVFMLVSSDKKNTESIIRSVKRLISKNSKSFNAIEVKEEK